MSKEHKIDDSELENVSGGRGISHVGEGEGGGGTVPGTGSMDTDDTVGGGNQSPQTPDGPLTPNDGDNDTPFSNYG